MVNRKIKIIVIIMSDKLVLTVRFEEAKTLGIIKKIEKGFKIPPDKYSNNPNWMMSINKKLKDIWLEIWVSFIKYIKKTLLNTPNNTTTLAKKKLNSNFNIKVTILIVNNWPIIPIHLRFTYVDLFNE